jgi:hypothetical protein
VFGSHFGLNFASKALASLGICMQRFNQSGNTSVLDFLFHFYSGLNIVRKALASEELIKLSHNNKTRMEH